MLFAIISAWLAYKKAKATDRNGILWAFIAVATFIGTQLIVGVALGVFLAFGIAMFGWSGSAYDTYSIPINLLAIVASFGSTWLVLRYLDKVPEDPGYTSPPAPPTDFNR